MRPVVVALGTTGAWFEILAARTDNENGANVGSQQLPFTALFTFGYAFRGLLDKKCPHVCAEAYMNSNVCDEIAVSVTYCW